MQVAQWRKTIGEMVRDHMRSPELEHYFSVEMNQRRAQVMIAQLGLYIRHRRDCWAHVSANCPVMAVKQKILEHEFGEVIKDQYSEFGHLHLIVRQAKTVGLTPEEVLNTKPIPSTTATLYAWGWITHAKSWIEGLSSLTVTEWTNDDRLLGDIGGGHSTRMGRRWMDDMGLRWRDMPNFDAHRQADEEHSDMFLPFLEEYATGEKEQMALDAVKESLDLFALYRDGVARAMEQIPLS
ncbi:MAG TPA: iron-containing redox enzyme family protein [Methylomirabilota bacterium]|nr:iron-containing redox enzyme family protein [Methylomirabilota bacterium]